MLGPAIQAVGLDWSHNDGRRSFVPFVPPRPKHGLGAAPGGASADSGAPPPQDEQDDADLQEALRLSMLAEPGTSANSGVPATADEQDNADLL